MNGIAYQLKARGRVRRLMQWFDRSGFDGPAPLSRRLKAMWRFREFDIGMSWIAVAGRSDDGTARIPEERITPIAGPPIPTTIAGYDDASWKLDGRYYVPLLKETLENWGTKRPKLRFRVVVSGHPRRVVYSPWIPLANMPLLRPDNQWLEPLDELSAAGLT